MKKEVYEEIIGSLEARRKLCFEHLGAVHTTDDLSQLSLAKAAELKRFCIEESDIMTKIVMVDLYHIIGMGNLSPTQMMEFTYKMQNYLSYRPRIKVIAQHLSTIEDLPTLPVTTKFKLLGLGDITLTYGEGDVVDEGSVDDYSSLKKELPDRPEDLPFTVNGSTIEVDPQRADYFIQLMEELFNVNLSAETFIKKVNAGAEYFGIAWKGPVYTPTDGKIMMVGSMGKNAKQKITAYYNKNN